MLAYLLPHGQAPLPRERLAFLLWPDSTEAQARTNLRQLIHQLRCSVPEAERHLVITPRSLHCRFDAGVWCDAVEFCRLSDQIEVASVENLARAAELYAGDLLAGHVEDWVLEDRERLRERSIDVLDRLS